jgi:hypothetical protein
MAMYGDVWKQPISQALNRFGFPRSDRRRPDFGLNDTDTDPTID